MKIFKLFLLLIAILSFFSACSVEISQTQIDPTRPPATPTQPPSETPTPTDTPPPTFTPTPTEPGEPTVTLTLSPTPTATFAFQSVVPPIPDIQILPEYASLKLQGRLLFLNFDEEQGQVATAFDLRTGEISTIFQTPPNGYLTSLSFSPNADQILISYSPPPPEGLVQSGYADLYLLTPDQPNTPQLFLPHTKEIEGYYSALFSPDQKYIYYLHYFEDSSSSRGVRYTFDRMPYPEGSPESIIQQDPFYPRLSPDGTRLAYVIYDLDNNGPDKLYLVNSDGSDPISVLDPVEFPTVDAPFFSPDNQYLYFGAVIPQDAPTPLTWWETLMGVQIAFAHPVPSDFFRVSLLDGSVERITNLLAIGMIGTFSPDAEWIAFITNTGLYVMQPDGSELVQVIVSSSLYGNLEWIP